MTMITCCISVCYSQNIDSGKSKSAFDDFVRDITADFDNFRQQSMVDFIGFVRNPWKEFEGIAPVPIPEATPTPPVVLPDNNNENPIQNNSIVIENIIVPITVDPQPGPLEPIVEVPTICQNQFDFVFFGTKAKVRYSHPKLPPLTSPKEKSVAETFEILSDKNNDNTIIDCLNLRKELHLCDWAYLKMLEALSKMATENENQAVVLMSYLMIRSGYKIRMANDGKRLYMLFASKNMLYNMRGYDLGDDIYYNLDPQPSNLSICQASFPNEKTLSFNISETPKFDMDESSMISRSSMRYPDVKVSYSVNKNLLDFFSTYPASSNIGDPISGWSLYANTPLDQHITSRIYPILKEKIKGKSEAAAVNMLLNFVQTGFKYDFDDVVWGVDRAFFAEESLYYPSCDCEDRSILFTRLVRDLLGLKCILIYYPGHLACGIQLKSENVNGDYIILNNMRFIVADPTYINASLGMTMPCMDNSKAKVILLESDL